MATVELLSGQKVVLALVATRNRIAADLVGTPAWTTSDASIAGILPAADGLTCEVTAKATGSATVTASAQGSGALNANHTINVTANNLADALAITIQAPPTSNT